MRSKTKAALALTFCIAVIPACSSVRVEQVTSGTATKLDGIPFYLSKPIVKVTTTTTRIRRVSDLSILSEYASVEKEVVEVVDTSSLFTINKLKPFAGESKFTLERSSSSNLSKVIVEDKEGITEFLKGILEGAKTLTEAAAAAKEAFVPMPAPTFPVATETALLGAGYFVEQSVSVTFEPLPIVATSP